MSILFLGGDKRQEAVFECLKKSGINSDIWNGKSPFDKETRQRISLADVIILPLPVSADGITLNVPDLTERPKLSDIIEIIKKEALVIGGKFAPAIKFLMEKKGIRYTDYFENEDFQIKNALLSAEGAIYTAMGLVDYALFGSKIAVVGFGRIGKLLAFKLKDLGANVLICARKTADIAWGECFGFKTLKIKHASDGSSLSQLCDNYDIIFNTVPQWIFEESVVCYMPSETLLIDLASPPFGIDERLVGKYALKYVKASGIPGKYSPASAGNIIGQSVMSLLEKEGMI